MVINFVHMPVLMTLMTPTSQEENLTLISEILAHVPHVCMLFVV